MTDGPPDEIPHFTEQARWLFAYHDSRGESLCSRAVALLGFAGVILVLLLGSGLPKGVEVTCVIKIGFVVTVGSLLATVGCLLRTLKSRELQVPGVDQLRSNWRKWVTSRRRGSAAKDVAETYLGAKDIDEWSALDWALQTASARALWFGRAVWFMGLSLALLTVLLIVVGLQVYF